MRKTLLLICIFGLFAASALANDAEYIRKEWLRQNPGELPIWLTEEEATRLDEIGRNFTPTDPPPGPVRQVAEFEPMSGVLIRYSSGLAIPYDLVAEMSQDATVVTVVSSTGQQNSAISNYTSHGVNLDNCVFMIAYTDSQWTRDYGPWFVFDGTGELGVVDFPYNRPRPNDDDVPVEYAAFEDLNLYGMNVIHTGGNYMCDGLGQAASTTLVYDENTISNDVIHERVESYLGITNYHVVEDPLGDYIEHIDCWGKYLDVDKIIIGEVPASDPRYSDYEAVADYFASQTSSWGTPMQVYRVYAPGTYPYTPYTNSLILNDKVFVPLTGSTYDDDAIAAYEEAMPGYQIFGIDYNSWYNTDALHCRTHELPDKGMLYVHHMPVIEGVSGQETTIEVDITAYSGANLIADSLMARYRMRGETDWSEVLLTDAGDNYTASLPAFIAGDTLEYYIHVADESGRSANHPFIGAPDPHFYTVPDITPPTIEHTPIEMVYIDEVPFDICAEITDNMKVVSANVTFWLNGEETVFEMSNTEDNTWLGEVDLTLVAEDDLTYQISALDAAGNECLLPEDDVYDVEVLMVSVEDEPLPSDFSLGCNPNPVRGVANVSFSLPSAQQTTIEVYNVRGQRVRTLASGVYDSGQHTIRWDGRNQSGAQTASGLYFLRMRSGAQERVVKVMLLR